MLEILDNMDADLGAGELYDLAVKAALLTLNSDLDDGTVCEHLVRAYTALREHENGEPLDFPGDPDALYKEEWVKYTVQHTGVSRERAEEAYCFPELKLSCFPTKMIVRVARAEACRDVARWKEYARLDEIARTKGVEALKAEYPA